jgi:hypothetical protein
LVEVERAREGGVEEGEEFARGRSEGGGVGGEAGDRSGLILLGEEKEGKVGRRRKC